jgi:4-amino-4-deoxy-L-arabinose transferase-like glycosyltransferase
MHIKFKTIEKFLLLVVVLLGAFIYFHKLTNNPPGLYADEVGTGYNAYSILMTGKDEYGKSFPLSFRLFGSYTPPLQIYLSVPLIAIFGFSTFSIRLLSVICGILLIPTIFFILKELDFIKSKFTIIITTLFFTITPWIVFFSRMGYEQNLAFLLFSLSILLILKSLKNPKLLLATLPLISLTTYADYPQRFISPLLFIGTIIIFRKIFLSKKNIRYLLIGFLISILIQIPNFYLLTTPSFFAKNDRFYSDVIIYQTKTINRILPMFLAYPLAFASEFLSKYFTYFSPRSLFFLPDPDPQRSIPELSVFYFWMTIPYLTGLYFIWKYRTNIKIKFIFFLLIITPLTGALTKDPFHIQRTLALALPLTIIMAIGIDHLISKLKIKLLVPIVFSLLIISLVLLYRSYFILLPQERAPVWGYGFVKLTEYIKDHPNYQYVIDQSERNRPQDLAYIQLAFYLKIPPQKIQASQNQSIIKNYYSNTNFNFIHKFGNIETTPIEWGESVWRDVVFVGDDVSISDTEVKLHNLTLLFEIKDPNNIIIFRGYKTNPKRLGK